MFLLFHCYKSTEIDYISVKLPVNMWLNTQQFRINIWYHKIRNIHEIIMFEMPSVVVWASLFPWTIKWVCTSGTENYDGRTAFLKAGVPALFSFFLSVKTILFLQITHWFKTNIEQTLNPLRSYSPWTNSNISTPFRWWFILPFWKVLEVRESVYKIALTDGCCIWRLRVSAKFSWLDEFITQFSYKWL